MGKKEERQALVSHCLRQCALSIDPRYGLLKEVAKELDVHPMTLTVWISNGRIPAKSCKALKKRFGRLVNVELLVQK